MSNANYLFFSNRDQECQTLIAMMRTETLLQYFNVISVDQGYPQGITIVPTLIIRNSPVKIEGPDTFKWIVAIKQWRQNMLLNNMSNEYNTSIGNNLQMNSSILGYSQPEMNAFSDSFALLQTDNPLPQTFAEHLTKKGDQSKFLIFTPPTEDIKIDESRQSKMVRQITKERQEQDSANKKQLENFLSTVKQ